MSAGFDFKATLAELERVTAEAEPKRREENRARAVKLRRRLRMARLRASGLPMPLDDFAGIVDGSYSGPTADAAQRWAAGLAKDGPRWLALLGAPGTGKTCGAGAAALAAVRDPIPEEVDGYENRYETMVNRPRGAIHAICPEDWPRLFDRFDRNRDDRKEALGAEVLILDDIGQEETRIDAAFLEVLNTWIANGRPLILSANLTKQQLLDRYDPRVADRLKAHCFGLELKTASYRKVRPGW